MNEKKYSCNVVQDLLPLYLDDVCSEDSKKIVEEHLEECSTCRFMKEQLENKEMDEMLKIESKNVIERHAQAEKAQYMTKLIGLDTIINLLLAWGIGRGLAEAISRLANDTFTEVDAGSMFLAVPITILFMFLVCEMVYFVSKIRKKEPFLTEKIAHISIGVKVVILIVGLAVAATLGAPIMTELIIG